ncbi:hypothetical protein E2E30_09000 [Sphingomonas sp. AAP5]|uniref:hypothetical protein n=1 Tax=Sphingomonas sp. AAP5 TaxID=1523415 RepID=UPI00105719E6|nr:hypothetical protein [Sphingomonas sp. AAP5]QBM75894.1 hypothetical protein E2E30_09000 [Sphingomonas sp. AAP5]
MSVRGIKQRVEGLEDAAGVHVPKVRTVFVPPHEDRDTVVAAANLKPDEMPIVVRFVAAGVAR